MLKRESPFQGLLVVDKPGLSCHAEQRPDDRPNRLPTSHDIVQMVRRWSGQKRIGHTGTLDPMATGVLVLCLGAATRLAEYYQGHEKQYQARIKLGTATDTYDALGSVTESRAPQPLSMTQIATHLDAFRGEILQTPPAYSAIKQGGESLHRKARRGEIVTPEPRSVTIHHLHLDAFQPPDQLDLQITCSAGTYIRSLAHDLGRALGTHAHLARLRRLAAGPFTLAEAHTVADIEQAANSDRLNSCMLALGYGLRMPRMEFCADDIIRLGHGQQIVSDKHPMPHPARDAIGLAYESQPGLLVQVFDAEGRFAGIARNMGYTGQQSGQFWKAEKWFAFS